MHPTAAIETLRHVQEIVHALSPATPPDLASQTAALANDTLTLLRYAGDGTTMTSLAQILSNLLDQILGLEHPETLNSRSNLANGYLAVGRYEAD